MTPADARAVADVEAGTLLATVELAAPPERVFAAVASDEITDWWVRPGVFDTRTWTGDVRPGGRWEATGMGAGDRPYGLEGSFLEIDPPRRLVHTWHLVGSAAEPSVATYVLRPADAGTWLTLRQTGFGSGEAALATAIGWETSLTRLAEILASERRHG
jgi:uncharacterized protein YndB with AHSA1/START domain